MLIFETFFDRFEVPFWNIFGTQIDQQMHLCVLFVVVFPRVFSMVFAFWRVLCSSYFGFVFLRCLHWFFIDFCSDLRAIWEHFGSSNRSLLASIFG